MVSVFFLMLFQFTTEKQNCKAICFCFRSPVERFNFWELRNKFDDVIIVCSGNVEVKSHKIILASASPFFRKELEDSNILSLPDIDKDEFERLLGFLYRGEAEVEAKHYQRFIEVARQLSVVSLRSFFNYSRKKSEEKKSDDGVGLGLASTKKRGHDGEKQKPESKKPKVQQDDNEGIPNKLIDKTFVWFNSLEVRIKKVYWEIGAEYFNFQKLNNSRKKKHK